MLEEAGKYACYYLCLCELAHKPFNTDDVAAMRERGLLCPDFTVMNAGAIFTHLTGGGVQWRHSKEAASYEPKAGELLLGCYELGRMNHFVVLNNKKEIIWNSMQKSPVTDQGKLVSVRVLRRA
jgi:hypothetical protein